jgi:cation diffusion facilitator family transporter
VGRRTRSSALLANAWHHRTDAISSIPAALAVAIAMIDPGWSFVDQVGAFVVSIFILHAAWRIMKPAFVELSDGGAPARLRARIHQVALETKEVENVHAVRARRMGSGLHVDLHITVDGEMTVSQGHDISETVKENIKNNVKDIIDVIVHLEPSEEAVEDRY